MGVIRRAAEVSGRYGPAPPVLVASRIGEATGNGQIETGQPQPSPARGFALDLARLRRRRYLVPGNFATPLARDVNAIKRRLWRALDDRGPGLADRPVLLLVTSTKPDEGKSFFSINLALSFLFEDSHRVMLVDGDGVRGGMSRQLGLKGSPGLNDTLRSNEIELESCLLRSERDGLEVIPAGSPSAADMGWTRRGSERVIAALRRVAMPNAVVVIDTPPLLAAPLAHLLAEHVDHVLFLVGAGHTKVDEIGLAVAQFPDPSRVSLVLNRAAAQAAASYDYAQQA